MGLSGLVDASGIRRPRGAGVHPEEAPASWSPLDLCPSQSLALSGRERYSIWSWPGDTQEANLTSSDL